MNKKIFEFNGSADLYQLLIGTPEILKQIIAEAGGKSGRVEITCDDQLYLFGDVTTEFVNPEAFRPDYTIDDLRWGEVADLQFDGADEMMGQGVVKMSLRETRSHDWMDGDDAEVIGS